MESLILQAAFGEYLAQLTGGIPLSQVEIVRPGDLGIPAEALAAYRTDAVNTADATKAPPSPCACASRNWWPTTTISASWRWKTRRWTWCATSSAASPSDDDRAARPWLAPRDELIPLRVVEQMAELGVFGLTVPEDYGGLGLGKLAMCVVTEELSRGYIGVGSLGTRSEIAAELIRLGRHRGAEGALAAAASPRGEILPTAVFTEPNTGSDLGAACTPARCATGDVYGSPAPRPGSPMRARTDLMTLLARTDPTPARLSRPVHVAGREAARHRRTIPSRPPA